jgi:hypothetical protein
LFGVPVFIADVIGPLSVSGSPFQFCAQLLAEKRIKKKSEKKRIGNFFID